MEKQEFISLLSNPGNIDFRQTQRLENILEEHPFFQPARVLRLKGLKNHNSFLYNSALKKTAAFTADRSILFDFIVSEEFAQNKTAEEINKKAKSEASGKNKKNEDINTALRMQLHEAHKILDPELFQGKQIPPKEVEEKLQIGKPLEFDKNESHSFSEWLKLTAIKPIDRRSENEERDSRLRGNDEARKSKLIDEFISKNPKISAPEKTGAKAVSVPGANFPDKLMTETLARVYLEQKNYPKAIQAYKILILKNPEKSGFFADQIRAIEKLQENQS
jgi:hypothetical protein